MQDNILEELRRHNATFRVKLRKPKHLCLEYYRLRLSAGVKRAKIRYLRVRSHTSDARVRRIKEVML